MFSDVILTLSEITQCGAPHQREAVLCYWSFILTVIFPVVCKVTWWKCKLNEVKTNKMNRDGYRKLLSLTWSFKAARMQSYLIFQMAFLLNKSLQKNEIREIKPLFFFCDSTTSLILGGYCLCSIAHKKPPSPTWLGVCGQGVQVVQEHKPQTGQGQGTNQALSWIAFLCLHCHGFFVTGL